MTRFHSDADVDALVADFESGRQDPESFDHARHIAVAMHYLKRMDEAATHERIRRGIKSLLRRHGVPEAKIEQVYNETITLFWIRLLAHLLDCGPADAPLFEQVNAAIEGYGSMAPALAHYSRERLFSEEARRRWLEPDLEPLPF